MVLVDVDDKNVALHLQVYLPYPDEQVGKNGMKVPANVRQSTTLKHTLREGQIFTEVVA